MKTHRYLAGLALVAILTVGAGGCRWCEEWWRGRTETVVPTMPYPMGAPQIDPGCSTGCGSTTVTSPPITEHHYTPGPLQ